MCLRKNFTYLIIFCYRDVASRNCLVNAQRIVKLGDFGMTRPMYENDYYKFNRKGKQNNRKINLCTSFCMKL